ncbi:MAG: hypothetical protein ACRENP_03660 [Longimicrobiales bacterium]
MSHQTPHSGHPGPHIPNLEQLLANMELRALKVSFPDERARIFNLAGDICFDGGARERALVYFGRAIDVHLAAEQIDAAVAVCRKIVRLTPEVVRARCTLAWMALGQGLIEEARMRIADYARAAASAGQEQTASRHLRLMTDVAVNQDVLQCLAEALLEIGDDVGANRAFGAAMGHRENTSNTTMDPAVRWSTVLRVVSGNSGNGTTAQSDSEVEYEEPPQTSATGAHANRFRASARLRRTR